MSGNYELVKDIAKTIFNGVGIYSDSEALAELLKFNPDIYQHFTQPYNADALALAEGEIALYVIIIPSLSAYYWGIAYDERSYLWNGKNALWINHWKILKGLDRFLQEKFDDRTVSVNKWDILNELTYLINKELPNVDLLIMED